MERIFAWIAVTGETISVSLLASIFSMKHDKYILFCYWKFFICHKEISLAFTQEGSQGSTKNKMTYQFCYFKCSKNQLHEEYSWEYVMNICVIQKSRSNTRTRFPVDDYTWLFSNLGPRNAKYSTILSIWRVDEIFSSHYHAHSSYSDSLTISMYLCAGHSDMLHTAFLNIVPATGCTPLYWYNIYW